MRKNNENDTPKFTKDELDELMAGAPVLDPQDLTPEMSALDTAIASNLKGQVLARKLVRKPIQKTVTPGEAIAAHKAELLQRVPGLQRREAEAIARRAIDSQMRSGGLDRHFATKTLQIEREEARRVVCARLITQKHETISKIYNAARYRMGEAASSC